MITYHTGNLLDAPAQALVNTVNTVGVMGKGIALQFRERFPHNYVVYQRACKQGELQPGKLLITKELTPQGEQLIINFPTKTEWFRKSTYAYVESGLRELARIIREQRIVSVAIPPLGCGNGGLRWEKIKGLIEQHLSDSPANVLVYEPDAAIRQVLRNEQTATTQLTPASAMFLYSLFAYESLGEASTVFAANKLAYFLQRLGEPLKLSFKAHHYGPYTPQVQHVLYRRLNGKYLHGLEQNTAKAFEPLELDYSHLAELQNYLRKHLAPEQHQRLHNMLTLIAGFQSALSLEVLASVDFLLQQHPNHTVPEVYNAIQQWSERKKHLVSEQQVRVAHQHLQHYRQKLHLT